MLRLYWYYFHNLSSPCQDIQQGSPPRFVKPNNIRRTESGSILLESELTANPAPTVTWLLNSKPVNLGDRRITTNMIEQSGIYTISMEISQVAAADEGEYKAVVKNKYGQATATITVNPRGILTFLRHDTIIGIRLIYFLVNNDNGN